MQRIRPQMQLDDGNEQVQVAPAAPSLAGHVASGTVWLGGMSAFSRVIVLGCQFVMMWLLLPEHFGAYVLVQSITMFATHLTNPGIDDVLVQKGKQIHRWTSAAFWLSLTCGVGGAVAMALLGLIVVMIARFMGNTAYGSSQIFNMILIYALGAPINALAMVPWVVLKSELRFGRIAMIFLFEVLAQQLLMVFLAWRGFGAYSFVIPMPIVAVMRTLLLWFSARMRVHARPGFHRWPGLVSSSGWVLGQRLLATGTHHGDQITLGTMYAEKAMNGHYGSAVTLTQQVVRMVCENLLQVLVPVLTSIQDNRARMEGAVSAACRALSAIIVPVAVLQILLAGPLIKLLLPPKWEPSIVLIQLLSLSPLLFVSAYPMIAMITATGRFRAAFFLAVVNLVCFLLLVVPGARWGKAPGAALAVAMYYWLAAHLFAAVAFRSMRGITVMHQALWRSLLSGAVAAGAGAGVMRLLPAASRFDHAVTILLITPLVVGVFVAMLRWLDPESLWQMRRRLGGAIVPIFRRFIFKGKESH